MSLLRDRNRADKAKQLLENELLTEAFKSLEDSYALAWRNSHIDDERGREKIFLAINVVQKVRDHLSAIVNMDGKMAEAELKKIAETAERKKRFGIV